MLTAGEDWSIDGLMRLSVSSQLVSDWVPPAVDVSVKVPSMFHSAEVPRRLEVLVKDKDDELVVCVPVSPVMVRTEPV